MAYEIKERCIYCGGDIYYEAGVKLVKCKWCGETLKTSKFDSELARIQQIEEENELVKQQLAQAEKEKQATNDRLFSALSSLSEIKNDQDILGKMLHTLTSGQTHALQNLQDLKSISDRLIDSQNDLCAQLGVMQDITALLQKMGMDSQEQKNIMNDFMQWSQQIHEEDVQRLRDIQKKSASLLAGQKKINDKVNELKMAADQHQKTLDAFREQYTKDKLLELRSLYRQAANFQHDLRFDKAEEKYYCVLTKGGEDAEVYWRLLMCHYCLFYQKDDKDQLIPIILNPDLTDPAEMSLRRELNQHMTEEDRTIYQAELDKIDRILDKYRLLKDHVQYDVFISVRQNFDGHYTTDSDVASDLYDFLTGEGLRVFNSRRTDIPAGHEYEPYIISALISSKVMIVVGTTPENMNSSWVKNEWSRFQWLQYREKEKTGKTERVLFCYLAKGMQADQIPKALNPNRQAIYDGVKAHNKLLSSLSFLKTGTENESGHGRKSETPHKIDYDAVKKQMTVWLSIGQYKKVLSKYEELTDAGLYLEQASLHLAALCAKKEAPDMESIVRSNEILDQLPLYKTAVRLCQNEEQQRELDTLLAQNREWRNKHKPITNTIKKETLPQPKTISKKNTIQKQKSIQRTPLQLYLLGQEEENKGNYTQAVKLYQEAADQGYSKAQYCLGKYYTDGIGLRINLDKAAFWYQKAAKQEHAEAQYYLAKCFENGTGINQDYSKAAYWYRKAAEHGHVEAQYSIGMYFANGIGVKKNESDAVSWLQKAADQESIKAKRELLRLKWNNNTGTTDPIKEKSQTEVPQKPKSKIPSIFNNYSLDPKSLNQNDKQQMTGLECFAKGRTAFDKKDYEEAAQWYKESAEKGYFGGKLLYASCLLRGQGVEKNESEAVRWYKEVSNEQIAQFELGRCYENGLGISANDEEAKKWYQKAIEGRDPNGKYYSEAKQALERLKKKQAEEWYQLGLKKRKSNNLVEMLEAYKLLEQAAEAGHSEAQYFIGCNYSHRTGAIDWLKTAAESGHPEAQYKYGYHLLTIEKNSTESMKWIQKAAESGNVYAQCTLGDYYRDGLCGVTKNKELAIEWYQKAANQGYQLAEMQLQKLTKKLFRLF